VDVVHRFQMNRPYLAFVPSQTERSPSPPHPARAARSSPAPSARIVLAAVSRGRREPESDFPGLSRYTGPWWLSPRGEGTGEGETPSPGKMVPESSSPATPTLPGLRPPPPPPGAGAAHGDIQWKAVPGDGAGGGFPEGRAEKDLLLPVRSRGPPCSSGPWWLSPRGEGTGERVSPAPQVGPRTFLLKAPPPGGGSTWRYRGKAVSRDAPPRIV